MGSESDQAKQKARLGYRNGFLCVVAERGRQDRAQPTTRTLCYPVRETEEAEVRTLLERPVTEVDSKEGIYVDEEGTVFQLAQKGETEPMIVEDSADKSEELEHLLNASLKNGESSGTTRTHPLQRTTRRRKKSSEGANGSRPDGDDTSTNGSSVLRSSDKSGCDGYPVQEITRLNLRQKLVEVRRRIGYVQKRGFNERNNYSYVTAADLAGAVGDILAELGVVIVPRLESISYEPNSGRAEVARAAQVVMAYTFTDVESGEEITTKVAGQGLDSGDKAPYKAMTGALKYALLQSFLLATGDDPEDERISHTAASGYGSERLVNADEILKLRALIDGTETELDRVLSYYKVNSLEEMRESSYRRAVELLNRKRAKQNQEANAHAQD